MKAKAFGLLGFIALFFISLILRPPVASIGPLLHEIVVDLGLTAAETSLLAAAPVFCFGIGAFASPALVRRFGVNRSMFFVLLVLLASVSLRLFFGYSGLLMGPIEAGYWCLHDADRVSGELRSPGRCSFEFAGWWMAASAGALDHSRASSGCFLGP